MIQRQSRRIQKPVPCDMACTQGNPDQVELFLGEKSRREIGSAFGSRQESFPHSCEIGDGRPPVDFFDKGRPAESALELTIKTARDRPLPKSDLVLELPSAQSLALHRPWSFGFIGINHQAALSAPCQPFPHGFRNRIIVLWTHSLVCG